MNLIQFLPVILLTLLFQSILCAKDFEPLERSVTLMGTTLHMTLYDPNNDRALRQSEEWIKIVEGAEQELSNWRESSELSRLNRHPQGIPLVLSRALCTSLLEAQKWSAKTEGAFDPGVGQLMKIWGLYGQAEIPEDSKIEQAVQQTGIRKIKIDERACTAIRHADVLLDSGAFGKGVALQRILEDAVTRKSAPFLIDFGGKLLVYGNPPEEKKFWDVELAHPQKRLQGSGIWIQIKSGLVSTSGGSERDQFVNGKRVGHILDPHTGHPALFFGSVTVWHESPLVADILSTALYVLGPQKGISWAKEHGIAACFLEADILEWKVSKTIKFSDLEIRK